MKFKSDFLWGAATAAYQVEGAAHADVIRTNGECLF